MIKHISSYIYTHISSTVLDSYLYDCWIGCPSAPAPRGNLPLFVRPWLEIYGAILASLHCKSLNAPNHGKVSKVELQLQFWSSVMQLFPGQVGFGDAANCYATVHLSAVQNYQAR